MSVSRTVSEIFIVEECHDLETGVGVVQGHWKWRLSIGHILLSIGLFFSYLTLNSIVTLKSGLEVTHDHSNWCHLKAWVRFPIRMVKKLWRYVKPFSSATVTSRTDGKTDRQLDRLTELLYQYRASLCWCAIKITFNPFNLWDFWTKGPRYTDHCE